MEPMGMTTTTNARARGMRLGRRSGWVQWLTTRNTTYHPPSNCTRDIPPLSIQTRSSYLAAQPSTSAAAVQAAADVEGGGRGDRLDGINHSYRTDPPFQFEMSPVSIPRTPFSISSQIFSEIFLPSAPPPGMSLTCALCHDEFGGEQQQQQQQQITWLPCQPPSKPHPYHPQCLLGMLRRGFRECALCKARIFLFPSRSPTPE